jgi:CheY-like chemotaxis protein
MIASKHLDVLVVEDHRDARDMLCDLLRLLGHDAHCVATGEEGATMLTNHRFDVLIADISLPGMSGFDLARMAIKTVPGIGIVFVSGFGYLIADKTDFPFVLLPKPYRMDQLKHALDQVRSSANTSHGAEPPSMDR